MDRDREELSALVGAVREIAAAVKRIEDRHVYMEGRLEQMDSRLARVETNLQEFRKETREKLAKLASRMNHHDRMFMDQDRRITELEEFQADDPERAGSGK